MTCRIRAGEVARPHECGFTPRAARPGAPLAEMTVPATRRAWVLHSCRSTPVDRSSGRRQDSASARTAPPLRRGLVVSHGSCLVRWENPNGTCSLCCYSPLARSRGRTRVRAVAGCPTGSGTCGGMACSAAWTRASRNLGGSETGGVPTPKGGTPFGPFRIPVTSTARTRLFLTGGTVRRGVDPPAPGRMRDGHVPVGQLCLGPGRLGGGAPDGGEGIRPYGALGLPGGGRRRAAPVISRSNPGDAAETLRTYSPPRSTCGFRTPRGAFRRIRVCYIYSRRGGRGSRTARSWRDAL